MCLEIYGRDGVGAGMGIEQGRSGHVPPQPRTPSFVSESARKGCHIAQYYGNRVRSFLDYSPCPVSQHYQLPAPLETWNTRVVDMTFDLQGDAKLTWSPGEIE